MTLVNSPLGLFFLCVATMGFVLRAPWKRTLVVSLLLSIATGLLSALGRWLVVDATARRLLILGAVSILVFVVLKRWTQAKQSRVLLATACIVAPAVFSVVKLVVSEGEAVFAPVTSCPDGWVVSGAIFPEATEIGCLDNARRRQGRWSFWSPAGTKQLSASYKDGVPDGAFVWWHENGQQFQRGRYKNGLQVGEWGTWTEEGRVRWKGIYNQQGELVNGEASYPVALPGGVVPPAP